MEQRKYEPLLLLLGFLGIVSVLAAAVLAYNNKGCWPFVLYMPTILALLKYMILNKTKDEEK